MELNLKGRSALVTGGSRGIGYGVAERLAAEGCNLHLASRSADSLDAARKKIVDAYGVKVTLHALDLSTHDNAVKLARACGPLDILINNAGAIPQGTLTGLDDKPWREAWDLKVFGFINVAREVYRDMCAQQARRDHQCRRHRRRAAGRELHRRQHGERALMTMSRALGADSPNYGVRVIADQSGRHRNRPPGRALESTRARKNSATRTAGAN